MTVSRTFRLGLIGCAVVAGAQSLAVAQGVDPARTYNIINLMITKSIVAVRSSEANKFSALSLYQGNDHGKWVTYTAPPGTRIGAVGVDDLLGLYQKGPDVKELAVFDSRRGEWTTQALPEPARDAVTPKVFADLVVYPVGKCVYVYQGKLRNWSTLTLPTDEAPDVMIWTQAVSVRQGSKLYVYSVANGTWSGAADAPREVESLPGGFRSVSPKAP